MKKKKNNNRIYLITFILSVLIISIIYKLNDVTPFGNKSLLCVDFYHQYGPMLGELYDRIHNFSSLIYSFNMGLGLPFFRNFLNYLSSPFNLLMLFFNRDNLVTSFSYIIGIKAVCSSVTMIYYLSKKFKTKELYLIPLAISYGFSAYFSAYYWNLMWLDGMVFLPLITLGIENIVNYNKYKMYTLWLAITLISNYYIGYMICIFSLLYFIIYSINKIELKKDNIKIFASKYIKFFLASMLAGGIASVFLIPMYYSIKSISAVGDTFPHSQYYSFLLRDFLIYHLTGANLTVFASDVTRSPNVSLGILSVILLLSFITNIEIPLKKKLCYLFLLSFFILAFFYAPLDFILQAFHVPNDLPYRYSFIYSFVLTIICGYSIKNLSKTKYHMSLLTYIFLMVMLLSTLVDKVNAIDNNMIYLNMIILTLYFVLYSRYLFKKDRSKLLYSTFIIVTIVPLIISINNNWNITQLMDSYYNNYDQIENTLDGIRKKDKRKFYRIEREESMTLNDPSWYNYYGMSTFSSMTYQDMAILQHKLGIPGNEINSHYYKQNTPIYDLMFNIDYYIGESNDLKRYTSFKVDNDRVYKFKYSLGLMYGVNKDIQYLDIENDNPFIVQNDYIGKATNIQDVLVKMDYIDKEEVLENGNKKIIKYTLINPDDNVYFYTDDYSVDFVIINNCIYYKNDKYNDYNISRNSEYYYYDMESYSEPYVINFNSYEDEINIYVGYSDYIDDDFYVYTIDNDKLDLAYSLLKNNKLEITKFMESKIIGEIQLDNDMMMYTSIPYDSGWHVLIDNKKVETYPLAKSLLMFEVPKGKHKIVVYYRIKGFYLGLMLTILSSIVVLFDKKIFKKKEERLN